MVEGSRGAWNPLVRRRERRLEQAEEVRAARRLVAEDVTALGEQVAAQRTADPSGAVEEADSQRDQELALALYERSKPALEQARSVQQVAEVEKHLVEARYLLARVAARRAGEDLPQRRAECFFNPQHGPAVADVRWTPPGGVEREVPVCMRDRDRLVGDEAPDVRLVRVGDRWVPWHEAAARVPSGRVTEVGLHTRREHTRLHHAEAHTRSGLNGTGGTFLGGPLG